MIELSLKKCNSLYLLTNVDTRNDKDFYNYSFCTAYMNYKICEDKYKSSDCTNEYYSFKPFTDLTLNDSYTIKYMKENYFRKYINHTIQKVNFNALSTVSIVFGDEPDTIYRHSPQQPPVEFVCFIGGVISLWTGISVLSLYAYGKRFIMSRRMAKQKSKCLFIKRYVIDSNC